MTARIIDGKKVAAVVRSEVASMVESLGFTPGLATILAGDDPASHAYVRGKRRDAEEVGIASFHHELAESTTQSELVDLVSSLNDADDIDGILVQLPLPEGIDADAVVEAVDPAKDVDGLHPHNLGRLMLGRPGLRPCTPSGIIRLLDHYGIETTGSRVTIVGRSFLVGRPLAMMLSERGADATVSMAHSRTSDLAELTRSADILVVAAGSPRLIGSDMVRPGATVIDVGVNRTDEGLVGDVDFPAVLAIAGALTPVPGGVGPMTRAMLLVNTLRAAKERRTGD